MRFRQVLGAAVVLALVSTACSGGSDKAKPEAQATTTTRFAPPLAVANEPLSEGTGACGVVNQTEVAAAVGSPANPGTGTRTKTGESCRWTLRSGSAPTSAGRGASPVAFVSVILSQRGRSEFDQFRKVAGPTAENLPGVGDQAFLTNDTGYVLKGEKFVILQVATTQSIPARKQAATRLITSAAARL